MIHRVKSFDISRLIWFSLSIGEKMKLNNKINKPAKVVNFLVQYTFLKLVEEKSRNGVEMVEI